MPDNPSPAAQPESGSEPIEFDFAKPAAEVPRVKRRSLKAQKPTPQPASATPAPTPKPAVPATPVASAPKVEEPSRTQPTVAARIGATSTPRAASATPTAPTAAPAKPATVENAPAKPATPQNGQAKPAATAATSPHGTRPATLYYTSQPKKEASETMNPAKSASSAAAASSPSMFSSTVRPAATPTASTSSAPRVTASATGPANSATARPAAAAPVSATSSTATPTSATRPAAATPAMSATRPSTVNLDYRANVERQSREQKSVGNILAYFVYGLLAIFLVSGGLAIYGAVVIFDKLHDQSTSISSLDDKYATKATDLAKQLATTQDSLTQAQAQISRQQDLINKEQEDLNKLLAQLNTDTDALRNERAERAQETAALRERIRNVDYRVNQLTPKQP